MNRELLPHVALEIEVQAAKVQRLAGESRAIPLERLRDETAALQALIAEATSEERRVDR